MRFKDLKTGIILEPRSEMVIEQMKNDSNYTIVEDTKEVKETPKKKKK